MRYVLDTNMVSALMKGDADVLDRLRAAGRAHVAMPQPVLAEIAYGLARLPDSKRKTALAERFALIKSEIPRADWNDAVSARFGAIKARLESRGERLEDSGVAIASHALAADAVLVTTDAAHFARVPDLRVEDWSA